ncbi:MAG: hypothetical protein EOP86_19905 [Verrucomicrobiaceae bacterium]|nr:MAG: hypothetical protein EOP86_19905 [Verrucomicrobiaceae bacterium]
MPRPWLLPSISFGLAALGGWCWGKAGPPKVHSAAPTVPAAASVPPAQLSTAGIPSGVPFLKWLDSLGPSDFAGKLAERQTLPIGPLSTLEEHLMLTRWAQLDPRACVGWMIAQNRTTSLEAALRIWGGQNPAEAWRAMASLPLKGEVQSACFKGLCAAVTEKDPDLFLNLPTPPEQDQNYQQARHMALRKLAATRPELALEHIHKASEFLKFDSDTVAALWARTQPEAALEWSEGSGWEPDKKELFQRAAIAAWAETDAEAAARFLVAQPALMHSGSRVDPDPRAAVTARLAAIDMKRSMAWLTENVAPEEQGFFVRSLRGVLPHDLTRWLPDFFASVPEGPHRGALLREVLAGEPGYPRFTGMEILQKLQAMPTSSNPDWLPVIKTIASEYARNPVSNFNSISEKFESLGGSVRAAVALELSQKPSVPIDPSLLVTALAEDPGFLSSSDLSGILKNSLPIGLAVLAKLGYRENCYTEAATLQAAKDPPSTADWVLSLGDDRARREAAAALVRTWCLSDEYTASEWTAAQPPAGRGHRQG